MFYLFLRAFPFSSHGRSLHGTCNLFIAFDALAIAVYQCSNTISFYVVLSGKNFIPLGTCMPLLVYAVLAISLNLCATFLVGLDRLISVLFPIM